MDRNNLDQSPPYSDNNGGSWVQCWDAEDSSISGLNLGEFRLFYVEWRMSFLFLTELTPTPRNLNLNLSNSCNVAARQLPYGSVGCVPPATMNVSKGKHYTC